MSANASEIVSSENEELILVDRDDVEIGTLNKGQCHDGDGFLHRAFSLFIFNPDGKLFLQQRSAQKRLWPLFWSNSCCSHPRAGESMNVAMGRRLTEELGITTTLEFVYKFAYQAKYGELGSENELCSVFLGCSDQPIRTNQSEIADSRFISTQDLQTELTRSEDRFTPWFRMEWQRLAGEFSAQLAKFAANR